MICFGLASTYCGVLKHLFPLYKFRWILSNCNFLKSEKQKMHNTELHNSEFSSHIITDKSRRMRWAGHEMYEICVVEKT
jgi:hypothetical protein